MISHPLLSVVCVSAEEAEIHLAPLLKYLATVPHLKVDICRKLPVDLSSCDCLVTCGVTLEKERLQELEKFIADGGGWLNLVDLSSTPLPDVCGVAAEAAGPVAELRAIFTEADHLLAARLPDAIYIQGRYHGLRPMTDDIEVLLYVDWQYTHTPVVTIRPFGRGRLAVSTLQDYGHPVLKRILFRLLNYLTGRNLAVPALRVGILGYAPSVGRVHGLGVSATAGLELRAVCDHHHSRCEQALDDFPGISHTTSAETLAADANIDLVIIATAPSSHAELSLRLMAAGKHVVCEKPLAINKKETSALIQMAADQQVHLSCHQNRRWDPDYLTIREHLNRGDIGDLFYLETFVGSYHHPCGYWHSHAPVSGGTAYDWGAHYLDWLVSLIKAPIRSVIGTRHKRVWQDVTNADQERIQLRFAGGIEAEFIHSDIAAARKPKWYILGTRGAITADWRDIRTNIVDPDHYYRVDDIPATEMTPELKIYQRRAEGDIVYLTPQPAERMPFAFHRNLADHLLLGEPLEAPLADSVKVVAILEAAARSMEHGGTVETIDEG